MTTVLVNDDGAFVTGPVLYPAGFTTWLETCVARCGTAETPVSCVPLRTATLTSFGPLAALLFPPPPEEIRPKPLVTIAATITATMRARRILGSTGERRSSARHPGPKRSAIDAHAAPTRSRKRSHRPGGGPAVASSRASAVAS